MGKYIFNDEEIIKYDISNVNKEINTHLLELILCVIIYFFTILGDKGDTAVNNNRDIIFGQLLVA